ncbi:unnamed protein product [Urochloa decumbens]|uniref:Uncharacterized protein n=1 Tax=Urochloa decumbens TaxID=240449 RepID=A0ABC9BWY7_9POAL
MASQEKCKARTYTPSPWGDFFLHHTPCTPSQLLSLKQRAQIKEEEVRQILLATVASSDLARKMELVDTLQRIGVDYHCKKEIDELLCSVYNDWDTGSEDLYNTSLRFYLLRKQGHAVSSDVFEKFRDEQGNISSDDATCLLMLYNAAHVRTHGEEILDNIITFNKIRLQSLMTKKLEPELAEEVWCTLETPRFRRVKRVEAKRYISAYEKKATRDETILEFAKMDYNILQAIYCNELKELTIWWKDFQLETDLRFTRDRMVELHFWMMGVVIHTAKSYHAEVKWRDEHYIPTNVEEHLQISMSSSVCMQITNLAFVSLGDVTTREDIDWAFTFPKIIKGPCIVGRIGNDITSHEREQASEHVVSTVQACMKQYGVTVEEANEKLRVIIEEAWMDIIEEFLERKRPMILLEIAVDLARTMDFMYKREDAFTLSFGLKEVIASMYVNPV